MKIGIMGGTFDPIHIGHLILGEQAYEQFGLDHIVYLPSGNPPHKRNRTGGATNAQRLQMVRLACAGNPHFSVSDREMRESGFSYTYRTLEEMRAEDPSVRLYFILGADSLFDFERWRNPDRICAACTLVAATRNHTDDDALEAAMEHIRERFHAEVERLGTETIDISSRMVRHRCAEDRSIRYYVPDTVRDYIVSHDVYGHLKGQA